MCVVVTCVVQAQCMSGYHLGPPGTSRGSLRATIVQLLGKSVKSMFIVVSMLVHYCRIRFSVLAPPGSMTGTSRKPPGIMPNQESTNNALRMKHIRIMVSMLGALLVLSWFSSRDLPGTSQGATTTNALRMRNSSRNLSGPFGSSGRPPDSSRIPLGNSQGWRAREVNDTDPTAAHGVS